jgi:hypothetical protein
MFQIQASTLSPKRKDYTMKKFYVIAGILSVSSIACASPGLPNSYTVQIDDSFSSTEVAIIEASMSSWTALSTDAPTFDFQITPAFSEYHVDQVPWGVIVVKKQSIAYIRSLGSEAVGVTETESVLDHVENGDANINPKTIGPTINLMSMSDFGSVISDNTAGAYFMTTAHETGHAIGLHHTGEGTVMNPYVYGAAPKPTCADLDQYCSLRPGLKCECAE